MYITATIPDLSKKCCMQYLFPLINYTSYKNKTSIFHLSGSLPTEGTLNPSSDLMSLAHPSPEVPQWLGWRESTWSTAFPGAAGLSSETTAPEEPSLPPTCCRARWGRAGQKEPGHGWKGWEGEDGVCRPRAVASSWHSWAECGCKLFLSPGGSSCWPHLAAPASRMLSQSARSAGAGAALAEGAQIHISVFGHSRPGSPNWSPRTCQVLDLASGPQALCSLGYAAQHSSVLHLRFLESRNKTGDKYLPKEMGAHSAPEVWGLLS